MSELPVGPSNLTFTNPVFPGWHSDPTCVFVPKWDNTFFFTASTFLAFPGLPIYASKDLKNWKLVSHVITRLEPIRDLIASTINQQQGVWAPTLRFHDGRLYVIVVYKATETWTGTLLLYTSENPYDSNAWADPMRIDNPRDGIDPDIFWDDDGKAYMALAGDVILQSEIDLSTGKASAPIELWGGTGGRNPEGPHIYKQFGWYFLLISEGGTELGHTVTIARSRSVTGPYVSYDNNPIMTNKGTSEYFQTVGHADIFQDGEGNWWGVALATRSGPEWEIYPMGREAVMFPASWDGEWPVFQPIRGRMTGWERPQETRDLPGTGPFIGDPEVLNFSLGSEIPPQLMSWFHLNKELYQISPVERPGTLRLLPSKANLTGGDGFKPLDPLTFLARRQDATLFSLSIDLDFKPEIEQEEAGVTLFITQNQHIDLGVVLLKAEDGGLVPHLRLRANTAGKADAAALEAVILPVPASWGGRIRLVISAEDDKSYRFSAESPTTRNDKMVVGEASALLMSGGSGHFTGTLVGIYATTNGGTQTGTPAYIQKWEYLPRAQEIDFSVFV